LLVIDIESGGYEIDEKSYAATDRVKARHPDGVCYLVRIGSRAALNLYFGSRRL
jgi:hypothetical protein